MKISTWNVNSVRAREERLVAWLTRHRPDVLCLQELKTLDAGFPAERVRSLGYHAVLHGQKTYNGVAILSLAEPTDVVRSLDDAVDDPQARLVAATVQGVRVLSAYVPNGAELSSDKYPYKLAWLKRLRGYLDRTADPAQPLALCGDFNVAPTDLDAADPAAWADTVLCHPTARAALAEVCAFGLTDVFRARRPDAREYSWWDYRTLGFQRNNGLRIDYVLATAPLAARCTDVAIDRDERKGKSPSDHAPVSADFAP